MNDRRSMGSNIHPSSQSRKISIGAMAEPKASSRSGPLRKGFIFVVLRIKKKYYVFVCFSTFSGGEIIGVGCILRVLFISSLKVALGYCKSMDINMQQRLRDYMRATYTSRVSLFFHNFD